MAVAATSALAISKTKLETMLSNSATFQAKVGARDAAAALAKIFLGAVLVDNDRDMQSLRPLAVVATSAELGYRQYAGGSRNHLASDGAVFFFLTDVDRYPGSPRDSMLDFDNFAGGVLDDLEAMAAEDDNLAVKEMQLEVAYHSETAHEKSEPPYWEAMIRVDWESF